MTSRSTRQRAQELIEQIHRCKLQAPKTIIFGQGCLDQLGELVFPIAWGQKAIIVTGKRSAKASGLTDRIETLLTRYTVKSIHAPIVNHEPTVRMVDDGAALARREEPKLILSVGGGSVMDFGKAIAALTTNPGSVEDYLEGVGKGLNVDKEPVAHIAIPTVAGTGAEVTKNAVVQSIEKGYKKSMRSDHMIPTATLVDPTLMIGVPPYATAAGGMDAITQLIECCLTNKRRKETTDLALQGLQLTRQALSLCYEDPENIPAREEMALASTISGVCLANSGLAMAHGIAAALGALQQVPHGLACGILLPHTLRYNRDACKKEMQKALAAFLNKEKADENTIEEGITAIEALNRWLQIPADLKFLGLSEEDLQKLAKAAAGSSMSGNPIPMTPDRTLEFLKGLA